MNKPLSCVLKIKIFYRLIVEVIVKYLYERELLIHLSDMELQHELFTMYSDILLIEMAYFAEHMGDILVYLRE